MATHQPAPRNDDPAMAVRRRAAVRTALVLGGIAVAIYVAFLLSGVFNA